MTMLKKHGVSLNLVCTQLPMLDENIDFQEALGDPEGLFWQVSIQFIQMSSVIDFIFFFLIQVSTVRQSIK